MLEVTAGAVRLPREPVEAKGRQGHRSLLLPQDERLSIPGLRFKAARRQLVRAEQGVHVGTLASRLDDASSAFPPGRERAKSRRKYTTSLCATSRRATSSVDAERVASPYAPSDPTERLDSASRKTADADGDYRACSPSAAGHGRSAFCRSSACPASASGFSRLDSGSAAASTSRPASGIERIN